MTLNRNFTESKKWPRFDKNRWPQLVKLGGHATQNSVATVGKNMHSGFLITSITFRRYKDLASINARHFYYLRAARILPPLMLSLFMIVVLALAGLDNFRNLDGGNELADSYLVIAVFSVLTFWHNVLMQHQGFFNYAMNVYWSLSVEGLFYVLFPLVCLTLKCKRYLIGVACLLIVIGPLYRWLHIDNAIDYRYAYLACFDAISFGVVAVLLQRSVTKQQM